MQMPWSYLKSDTLLLTDIFEKLRKMCSEIYELDPEKYLLAPGLALQPTLEKADYQLILICCQSFKKELETKYFAKASSKRFWKGWRYFSIWWKLCKEL